MVAARIDGTIELRAAGLGHAQNLRRKADDNHGRRLMQDGAVRELPVSDMIAHRKLTHDHGANMSSMHGPVDVLVLAASLRKGSLNQRLADLAAAAASGMGAKTEAVRIADYGCPFYDEDLEHESGFPEGARRFCERVKAADAIIIASPEYNASMPGILKNLIAWVSRFRPQPLNGRQALLMSASPSMVGGNRGLWSLRVPLEHLGARVYPDMFSLAQAHQAFAPNGQLGSGVLSEAFR